MAEKVTLAEVADTLKNHSMKLEAQQVVVEDVKELFRNVQVSNDIFISKVSMFATTLAIVFGLGALANGMYQADRLNDAVKKTEENDAKRDKRLEEYFGTKEAKTATVKNALDDEDIMYAAIYLDADYLGNNISSFKVVIDFGARFSFEGTNTAVLNGYEVQYDRAFTDAFYGPTDEFVAQTSRVPNLITANNLRMVSGIEYLQSWSHFVRRTSCDEVVAMMEKLLAYGTLGVVTVAPVYEVASQPNGRRKFSIKPVRQKSAFSCSDFDKYRVR